jgi:small subunit ribosomal protein S8
MHTDSIADILTRIRNAQAVKKNTVVVPFSKVHEKILSVLKDEGYIKNFIISSEKEDISVELLYIKGRKPKISHIKRISKPGRRIYTSKNNIPSVLNNYGIAIISTNKGIITDKQALEMQIGGEVLLEVY